MNSIITFIHSITYAHHFKPCSVVVLILSANSWKNKKTHYNNLAKTAFGHHLGNDTIAEQRSGFPLQTCTDY